MGRLAAFYEGMDMEMADKDSNISDCSLEGVINIIEATLRDFEVEELDIIEIIDNTNFLKKQIVS